MKYIIFYLELTLKRYFYVITLSSIFFYKVFEIFNQRESPRNSPPPHDFRLLCQYKHRVILTLWYKSVIMKENKLHLCKNTCTKTNPSIFCSPKRERNRTQISASEDTNIKEKQCVVEKQGAQG